MFPLIIGYIPYLVVLYIASGLLLFRDGATYKQLKQKTERKISHVFAILNISIGLVVMVAYWMQSILF